jgi:peptide/nickel transport system substrate-binding protein
MARNLKRRDFLRMSSLAVVGAVVAACAPATPLPTEVPPTQTPVAVEKVIEKQVQVTVEVTARPPEPPMLADLVINGSLPAVDERLPEKPLVVGGRDAIGVYGGEVRMIHNDPTGFLSNYDWNVERFLHYSDIDLRTIVPNIFESWETSADATTYTIHLRKGMKWSTGDALTTEDIRFTWEDFLTNKDLNANLDWRFRFGGAPMKVDIIDDYAFKITFAQPFGNFPAHMTRMEGGNTNGFLLPSKFLKQFHAKYTDPTQLAAAVKNRKLETWQQLFNSHTGWGFGTWGDYDPGYTDKGLYPLLSPWHIVSKASEGLYLLERNPYYWKTDLAGNQLPYLDKMRFDYTPSVEAYKLKLAQGELDALGMHDVTMADYPFYKENEPKANYIVGDYLSCMGDRYVLFPQFVQTEDAVLQDIINDPRFLQALSMGINRDEINQNLFFGTARMGQMSPMPSSKYYKEKYGTAWATFDKDAANKLLDAMGLDKLSAQGIRLRKDGNPLTFVIEHTGTRVGPAAAKLTEMVSTYWRDLGIDASTKEIQEQLYVQRMNNGQVNCGLWYADRCTDMLLHIEMDWYIPVAGGQGGASSKWAAWYNAEDKTAAGLVKPPDTILHLYDLYAKMTSVVSEDDRVAAGQEIFDWLVDNPLAIGLILECPAPIIFNKNMRNLPRPRSLIGWDSYGVSTYHPEAFYYEGGQRA